METQQTEQLESKRKNSFSSRLQEKLSTLRTVPRYLKRAALRIATFTLRSLRSNEVRQIKLKTISIVRLAYHGIVLGLNRAWNIALPLARSLGRRALAFRRSAIRIPSLRKIPQTKTQLAPFPALPPTNVALPVNYPASGPVKFSAELESALKQFSSLPMWFTLPIIFAASFTIGIIVSILV